MWRSSKAHVADELQLPPQEDCTSWLSFSPVEEHFYLRQHESCASFACEIIKSLRNDLLKREASGWLWRSFATPVKIFFLLIRYYISNPGITMKNKNSLLCLKVTGKFKGIEWNPFSNPQRVRICLNFIFFRKNVIPNPKSMFTFSLKSKSKTQGKYNWFAFSPLRFSSFQTYP